MLESQTGEGGRPIDQSDGGEDDEPAEHAQWVETLKSMGKNPRAPWTREIDVLSIDPADQEALAAMEALYQRTERWSDLIGVYRRRIELAEDPAAREKLYAGMAEVYETQLHKPEEAIAAYKEVLGFDETSNLALTALDGLFTRQSKWEELADNLEAQLRLAYD